MDLINIRSERSHWIHYRSIFLHTCELLKGQGTTQVCNTAENQLHLINFTNSKCFWFCFVFFLPKPSSYSSFLIKGTVIHYRTEWKWSNCSHWKDFCTCWIGFYWSSLKQMFIYTSSEFIFLGWMKIETSWSREWRKSAFHGNHNWEEFDNSKE